ncbi:cell wall metabolism sensor histidine kinase WalK, partial [bacterium]|nr:cell wall metabolism sensor histidine kinase WalK [bacterium]
DNGFGISQADQQRLFQKFFRVKNAQTRHIGGTGLGLCITRTIIEAHQGHITLESDEGKGSTFSIHLPAFHE